MNITLDDFHEMALEVRNWGRWGDDDEIGTLNFVTGESVRSGRDEILLGESISLAIDFGSSGPQTTGQGRRFNPIHWMLETGTDTLASGQRHGYADDVVTMCVHGATHWDGLGHGFYDGKMWNGYDMSLVDAKGVGRNSVTAIRDRLAGRAILIDVARWTGVDALDPGFGIRAEHLEACVDAQNVQILEGDFLVIRTGQIGKSLREGWGRYAGGEAPGLTLDTAKWLRDKKVAGIATDTWGAEVRPNEIKEINQPWHRLAIPNLGLTVGEMFNTEALSEACERDRRYAFFLCAGALPIERGTGSPVNPIAIR